MRELGFLRPVLLFGSQQPNLHQHQILFNATRFLWLEFSLLFKCSRNFFLTDKLWKPPPRGFCSSSPSWGIDQSNKRQTKLNLLQWKNHFYAFYALKSKHSRKSWENSNIKGNCNVLLRLHYKLEKVWFLTDY